MRRIKKACKIKSVISIHDLGVLNYNAAWVKRKYRKYIDFSCFFCEFSPVSTHTWKQETFSYVYMLQAAFGDSFQDRRRLSNNFLRHIPLSEQVKFMIFASRSFIVKIQQKEQQKLLKPSALRDQVGSYFDFRDVQQKYCISRHSPFLCAAYMLLRSKRKIFRIKLGVNREIKEAPICLGFPFPWFLTIIT